MCVMGGGGDSHAHVHHGFRQPLSVALVKPGTGLGQGYVIIVLLFPVSVLERTQLEMQGSSFLPAQGSFCTRWPALHKATQA